MTIRLTQHHVPRRRARFSAYAAWVLCALSLGCTVYPEPERKSINELYFEALAANAKTPEQTLGANPSAKSTMLAHNPSVPRNPKFPVKTEDAATIDGPEQPPEVPPVPPESALQMIPGVAGSETDSGSASLESTSERTRDPAVELPTDSIPAATQDTNVQRPEGLILPPVKDQTPAATIPATQTPAPAITDQSAVGDAAWSSTLVVSADKRRADGWKKHKAPASASKPSRIVQTSHRAQFGQAGVVSSLASSGTVTESFEETDVRQALQLLASQAGVAIIVDERVDGTVTTLIENEPFETALRKVVLPLGLIFRQTAPKEYIVSTADPASPLFSRVSDRSEYRPLHLSPDELVKLLPTRESRFVTVVDKRNLLIVEAPQEIAGPILERLQAADNPIPQVELEAIVCVIAPDKSFKSGLDWGHAVTMNGNDLFRIGMTGLAVSGAASGTGTSDAFSSFAVTSTFVKLLAQEGYLTIRAAPRVTARDGEPAKIAITRQSFFSTQPNSANAFFRQELQDVEAGITLEITPIIRGDNITVKIEKAEVSEDIRTTDVNANIANNPYPLINRRSVATTVNVKDEETIVIGGLVQRQTVDRIARIPVLGSIPYAGRIFQTVEKLEQDAEVVIFISPRIVTSGPACTAATTPAPVAPADGLDVPN